MLRSRMLRSEISDLKKSRAAAAGGLARISHTKGVVIAMKRVEPSLKGPKSVAKATVEALSAMGGRFMATPQDSGGVAGVRSPTSCGTPLARCWASRCADFLDCRAPDTRADPFSMRNPG